MHLKNTNMNKKVGFKKVLADTFENQTRFTRWVYILIFFAASYLSHHFCFKQYPEIVPCFCTLLGFTIACFSLILNLGNDKIEKLSEKADNGKIPLNVICSSLVLSILFQVVTIILAYLNSSINCNAITSITNSFAILSLCSLLDIALTLFCIHTYFKK